MEIGWGGAAMSKSIDAVRASVAGLVEAGVAGG
jgi:hypothetical protein